MKLVHGVWSAIAVEGTMKETLNMFGLSASSLCACMLALGVMAVAPHEAKAIQAIGCKASVDGGMVVMEPWCRMSVRQRDHLLLCECQSSILVGSS